MVTLSAPSPPSPSFLLIALGLVLFFLLPLANWQVNLRGRGAATAGA